MSFYTFSQYTAVIPYEILTKINKLDNILQSIYKIVDTDEFWITEGGHIIRFKIYTDWKDLYPEQYYDKLFSLVLVEHPELYPELATKLQQVLEICNEVDAAMKNYPEIEIPFSVEERKATFASYLTQFCKNRFDNVLQVYWNSFYDVIGIKTKDINEIRKSFENLTLLQGRRCLQLLEYIKSMYQLKNDIENIKKVDTLITLLKNEFIEVFNIQKDPYFAFVEDLYNTTKDTYYEKVFTRARNDFIVKNSDRYEYQKTTVARYVGTNWDEVEENFWVKCINELSSFYNCYKAKILKDSCIQFKQEFENLKKDIENYTYKRLQEIKNTLKQMIASDENYSLVMYNKLPPGKTFVDVVKRDKPATPRMLATDGTKFVFQILLEHIERLIATLNEKILQLDRDRKTQDAELMRQKVNILNEYKEKVKYIIEHIYDIFFANIRSKIYKYIEPVELIEIQVSPEESINVEAQNILVSIFLPIYAFTTGLPPAVKEVAIPNIVLPEAKPEEKEAVLIPVEKKEFNILPYLLIGGTILLFFI